MCLRRLSFCGEKFREKKGECRTTHNTVSTREYWIIYRGPGLLVVVWFGSSPIPSPSSPLCKLSLFLCLPVCRRLVLLAGEGGESNYATARKPGLLQIIQYSLVGTLTCCTVQKQKLPWHTPPRHSWSGLTGAPFSRLCKRRESLVLYESFNTLW